MWQDLIGQLEEIGGSLQQLWPIGVFFLGLYGLGRRLFKRFEGSVAQIVTDIEAVVEAKIAPIRAEVTYNGGGSMKDAVRRLEVGQSNINDRLDRGNETLDHLSAQESKNEGRLQVVTTNLPAAYYEMDALGNVTAVNDAYLVLFQLTEEEALNSQEWRRCISAADLDQIDRSGQQSMMSHKDWYCTFTVSRNGIDIPVVGRAKALFTNDVFSGFSGAMTYNLDLIK